MTASIRLWRHAQELKFLFYEAYTRAQQRNVEVQGMGRAVLANQFVSGLQPDLKAKLVLTLI